jgi:hypothetical protein
MNHALTFLFIFLLSAGNGIVCAQSKGGRLLTKAETSFSNGKISKAKRLIFKAEKAGFGFCAVTTAYDDFAILKAKLRAHEGLYYDAGQEIASTPFALDPVKMDSIQLYYYSLELGREQLKIAIDSCLEVMASDSNLHWKIIFDSIYFAIPQLGNNPIQITSFPIMLAMKNIKGEMNLGQRFLSAVRAQAFYIQLE